MAEATPWIPVAITVTGGYLAWFGVHYWRSAVKWPSDPVKAVLTGKGIPDNTKTQPAIPQVSDAQRLANPQLGAYQTGPAVPGDTQAAFGQAIAQHALQYEGAGYVWGGDASVIGKWDCSSFASKVLGQDMGMTLPGGGRWGDPGYPPHDHGPGSTQFMLYGTGVTLDQVQPGDLIVSTEHIGICIGPGQMISAEDPQDGTRIGTFPAGFPAGPPVYRRPTATATPMQVA